ncbi:MAG: fibronectin type III domain-containing protein, partial [bacterium]|nr:fibronectin type III domain-containing protein [bacterium]
QPTVKPQPTVKVPSQVKNVKVVKQSSSKVKVSWKKLSGVTGYEVYMKTNNGQYKKVYTNKGASKVTYTRSGLKKGYRYSFKVRAYNKLNGKTAYGKMSSVASIRMPVTAPSSAKAKKDSKTSVKVSWSKVSDVTGYEVYMKTGSKSYSKVATIKKSNTCSYKKTKLKKGTKYTFRVRAYKVVDGKKYYSGYKTTKQIRL